MTPRRLAAAAVALAVVIGGVVAAVAALTSEPAEPDRAAAAAPARPADPVAAPLPAAPDQGAPAMIAARTPPPAPTGRKPVIRAVTPKSGPVVGGGQAVIQGSNLGGVAQVMFGTTPARIASRGDDALTVDVPAGTPGAATLVLTNADGNYAVAPSAYTYR
jgi:hypothetical protein